MPKKFPGKRAGGRGGKEQAGKGGVSREEVGGPRAPIQTRNMSKRRPVTPTTPSTNNPQKTVNNYPPGKQPIPSTSNPQREGVPESIPGAREL